MLRPWLDSRLEAGTMIDPDAETIRFRMERAMREGYEGLMLRQGDKLLKVKPKETHDVPITGIQPGTGKHEGRMGALLTPMGKVGTGFTDEMRENFNDQRWIGIIIEVECMGLTPGGKFRHPRFVRVREDKC
jgi:ATP-dependent DNA ligase